VFNELPQKEKGKESQPTEKGEKCPTFPFGAVGGGDEKKGSRGSYAKGEGKKGEMKEGGLTYSFPERSGKGKKKGKRRRNRRTPWRRREKKVKLAKGTAPYHLFATYPGGGGEKESSSNSKGGRGKKKRKSEKKKKKTVLIELGSKKGGGGKKRKKKDSFFSDGEGGRGEGCQATNNLGRKGGVWGKKKPRLRGGKGGEEKKKEYYIPFPAERGGRKKGRGEGKRIAA